MTRDDGRERNTQTVDVSAEHVVRERETITAQRPTPGGARRRVGPGASSDPLVRVFLQPDAHYPYHDKRACELILRVLEKIRPEVGVVLGDHWDFFAISDHRKEPSRKLDLEWEIQEGDKGLREYEALGCFKRLIICEGNHEWRLQRYIADKASEVYRALSPAGLLSVQTLPGSLGLRERGWEWIPYMDYGRIGSLYFTHDVGKAGKSAHESAQGDFEGSTVIGHTHQLRLMSRGNHLGAWHTGAMFGWLGDWRAIDYKHRMKIKREWPLGFGLASIEKTTDIAHVQTVLIQAERRRYRCVVDGMLFTA